MDISTAQYYADIETFFRETLPHKLQSQFRPGQLEMALAVAHAFAEQEAVVVEAGTGIGKSLAYLVPALLWRLHGGKNAPIISTRTINLQEQLLHKDIPLVLELVAEQFALEPKVCLARGKSNYLCRRRFRLLWEQRRSLATEQARELNQVLKIINRDDDRQSLLGEEDDTIEPILGVRSDFNVTNTLWNSLCCDTWNCPKRRCSEFMNCYLYRDRIRLAVADLIVANHSLVMSDAALRRAGADGILPSVERLVLDEAHHIESVATEHLSYKFNRNECRRVFWRLAGASENHAGDEGILPQLREKVPTISDYEVQNKWNSALDRWEYDCLERLSIQLDEFFQRLRDYLESQDNQHLAITAAMLESIDGYDLSLLEEANQLQERLDECADLLHELQTLSEAETAPALADAVEMLSSARDAVLSLSESLSNCLNIADQNWIRWVEASEYNVSMQAAPLHINEYLREFLYQDVQTLVLTSATLRIKNKMDFFLQRIGLQENPGQFLPQATQISSSYSVQKDAEGAKTSTAAGEGQSALCSANATAGQLHTEEQSAIIPLLPLQTLCCASPFDYRRQALLGVATDVPDYANNRYYEYITPHLVRLATALNGKMLILAASWESMNQVSNSLEKALYGSELRVLRQTPGQRTALIEEFRCNPGNILVGTDSFWEGVDIQGDALQCVVILKVPFVVPTDPVHKARMDDIQRCGGNSFRDYSLPLAITKMRQGAGRLIRGHNDRGSILILDSRLVSKNYGAGIERSLPPCTCLHRCLGDLVEATLAWTRSEDGLTGEAVYVERGK